MKTLYDPTAAAEIKQRIASLTPQSERLWGKMSAPQMLAHCSATMEQVVGDTVLHRVLIGRLIGPLFKAQMFNDKPWSKSGPTAPELLITGDRDLAIERDRLNILIDRFSTGGPEACTKTPHAFFGKLTPEEWGKGMYKHLDHHLRQFNA
jgi:hypothetical protein